MTNATSEIKIKKSEALDKNGKIWNKDMIKDLLKRNDKAVTKGLMIIYSYQTEEEKHVKETCYDNGMGFSGIDAEFLSSMAEKYQQYGRLTEKQMLWTRKKMLKYAGQLIKHMRSQMQK